MKMKVRYDSGIIAKAGYPFALIAIALAMLGGLVSVFLTIPFVIFFLFTLYFFRNPNRVAPSEASAIVSPADGRVLAVADLFDRRYFNDHCRRVSIFMSPMNVHVNRMPYEGVVKRVIYNPGRYFAAYADKASLENEQNAVEIECVNGQKIVFVQIAGFIARRIICDARKGDVFKKGERYGLIRFGSRMDVYLPLHCKVDVKTGDIVQAGTSVIARF